MMYPVADRSAIPNCMLPPSISGTMPRDHDHSPAKIGEMFGEVLSEKTSATGNHNSTDCFSFIRQSWKNQAALAHSSGAGKVTPANSKWITRRGRFDVAF